MPDFLFTQIAGENIRSGTDILQTSGRDTIGQAPGRYVADALADAALCDGVTVTDCWQDGTVLTQGSFGAAFSFAECRNVLLMRPRATGVLSLVKLEAGAEATVIGGRFENTNVNAAGQSLGSQVAVVNCTGRSSVTLHDLTITDMAATDLIDGVSFVGGFAGLQLRAAEPQLGLGAAHHCQSRDGGG